MGTIKWSIFRCKGGVIQHANAHQVVDSLSCTLTFTQMSNMVHKWLKVNPISRNKAAAFLVHDSDSHAF